MMNVRDLVPWSRNDRDRALAQTQTPAPQAEAGSPFLTLHREMNRLFDDVFRGLDGPGSLWSRQAWPQLEVRETQDGYRVTAELPGIDEKDVEVTLDAGVLAICGEKKSETEDQARSFSERWYGRFERRIALDRDVDEGRVKAEFRNGLLTVDIPRAADAAQRARRIPINASGTAH